MHYRVSRKLLDQDKELTTIGSQVYDIENTEYNTIVDNHILNNFVQFAT